MKTQLFGSLCLVVCISARASIAYFNGPAFAAFTAFESVGFDRNGAAEFSFFGGPSLTTGDPGDSYTPTYVSAMRGNAVLAQGANAAILPAGAAIDANVSNSIWSTNDLNLAAYGTTGQQVLITANGFVTNAPTAGWGGPLARAGSGFLAVRLIEPDGIHYGWIRATLQDTPVIIDWACETEPNTAIVAGAVPAVALQAPKIIRPGNLRLLWDSTPGTAYQIQFAPDLQTLAWSNLELSVVATGDTAAVDVPLTGASGFYRVLQTN